SIDSLEKGNYTIWARVRDKDNKYSNSQQESFTIGNAAPSEVDFTFAQISGGIQLTNTRVFDADGMDDLEKVDFQLKKDDNKWENVADAVEFRSNENGTFSFDYSINSLEAGDSNNSSKP
ncbi:MAG: hypothetical protein AAFX57_08825, partial [Bacteroidota bacterium]